MEIHGAPGVDGEALVDQKMIGLVLDHLLYNAVQHTPSGTRVDVTVSSNEHSVQIAVDDDGPGISEELRQHLLPPEIVVPPAVFLASEAGRRFTGRRLVATEWSPEHSEGYPAASGIGG